MKKNVIMIVVDALRYDFVGEDRSASPSFTPDINSFFENGMRFHNVYSVSFPTQFAMPGLFVSQLPLSNGGYHLGITNRGETLGEWFKGNGYKTIGLTTDYHTSSCYGYGKGFDEYVELHDIAWHANGVLRNDFSYLKNKKNELGMSDNTAVFYAKSKLLVYIPYVVDFINKKIKRSENYSQQIDNWNFHELKNLLTRS